MTTKERTEHTALPWFFNGDHEIFEIQNFECRAVCALGENGEIKPWRAFENAKANGAFIVRAVNNHDDLIRACEFAIEQCQNALMRFGTAASQFDVGESVKG